MKIYKENTKLFLFFTFFALTTICYGQEKKIANIDLTHWKVTIPEGPNGKPLNVQYPEILDFANNPDLKKYMYNDYSDGSIVFYAFPSGITTANSSYSRSELREQVVPGKNNVNWTFAQGGKLKGTLAMAEVTKDAKGKYHKVIVMQIHGRLSNEQKDLIGEDDNNAPPMLKIYWDNGKVRVKTKILKDQYASDKEILETKAWIDDKGYNFKEKVDFNKFTLEVIVSDGRMEIILNGKESVVYDGFYIKKWGVFENYFKAGNYLQTKDLNAAAKVKYYELEVSH